MADFSVPDIHCEGCVRALTGAARDLDGAATVQADLVTKRVRVHTTAADEAVAAAFREAGFTVHAANSPPD